jgi:hypothetical protein
LSLTCLAVAVFAKTTRHKFVVYFETTGAEFIQIEELRARCVTELKRLPKRRLPWDGRVLLHAGAIC